MHPRDAIYEQLFADALPRQRQRQIQIMDAAIECYVKEGIENTSFELLSQRCQVTRPLIHHYFKDKRALFEKVVKYIRVKFQQLAVEALMKEKDPQGKLDAYVNSTFDALEQFPEHAHVWHLFYYYCGVDKNLRALNTDFVKMGHERITSILEAGIKAGQFPKMDARAKAKSIQVLITGALNTAATEDLHVPFKKFRKQMFDDYRRLLIVHS